MCGSDGRSYRHLCQLRHQACLSGSNLHMIHEGESRGPATSRSVHCIVNLKLSTNHREVLQYPHARRRHS